jgi:hypothetical protein
MSYEERTEARLKRVESEGEEIGAVIVETMHALYAKYQEAVETLKAIKAYNNPSVLNPVAVLKAKATVTLQKLGEE